MLEICLYIGAPSGIEVLIVKVGAGETAHWRVSVSHIHPNSISRSLSPAKNRSPISVRYITFGITIF